MIFIKHLTPIVFLLFIVSCSQGSRGDEHSDNTQATSVFQNYLSDTFREKIPLDSAQFLLISKQGCSGCIEKTLRSIHNMKNATCILSLEAAQKYSVRSAEQFWVDSTNLCDRLTYNFGNVGLLLSANASIYQILELTPENIDSILALYLKGAY